MLERYGDSVVCVKSIFLLRVFFTPFVHFSLHFVGNIIFTHGIGWKCPPESNSKSGKTVEIHTHTHNVYNTMRRECEALDVLKWARARTSQSASEQTKWNTQWWTNERTDGVDAVNNILRRKDGSLMSTSERNKLNRKVWGAHIARQACMWIWIGVHCPLSSGHCVSYFSLQQ